MKLAVSMPRSTPKPWNVGAHLGHVLVVVLRVKDEPKGNRTRELLCKHGVSANGVIRTECFDFDFDARRRIDDDADERIGGVPDECAVAHRRAVVGD
jgi:hypothetical protein